MKGRRIGTVGIYVVMVRWEAGVLVTYFVRKGDRK